MLTRLLVVVMTSWVAAELEQDCSDQQLMQLQDKFQKCTFQLVVEFESSAQTTVSSLI